MPLHTVAYNFFYLRYWNANHYWNFRDAAWNWVNAAEKDARLNQNLHPGQERRHRDLRDRLRGDGLLRRRDAELRLDGEPLLTASRGSTSHYAFKSIANQINQLKTDAIARRIRPRRGGARPRRRHFSQAPAPPRRAPFVCPQLAGGAPAIVRRHGDNAAACRRLLPRQS